VLTEAEIGRFVSDGLVAIRDPVPRHVIAACVALSWPDPMDHRPTERLAEGAVRARRSDASPPCGAAIVRVLGRAR
jgi:hypothetical protein